MAKKETPVGKTTKLTTDELIYKEKALARKADADMMQLIQGGKKVMEPAETGTA
jgi:hypothetical protein